jgi:C4-dicarboxylate-specific signal transduction histidine kinase
MRYKSVKIKNKSVGVKKIQQPARNHKGLVPQRNDSGAAALVASELEKNQVLMRMELADDLPLVVGDRVELQQVVLNLCLNSIEAMSGDAGQPINPPGLQTCRQRASARARKPTLLVSVADCTPLIVTWLKPWKFYMD